jgi:hypothetical protein
MDDQATDRERRRRLTRVFQSIGFTGFLFFGKGAFFADDLSLWAGAVVVAISIVGESFVNRTEQN